MANGAQFVPGTADCHGFVQWVNPHHFKLTQYGGAIEGDGSTDTWDHRIEIVQLFTFIMHAGYVTGFAHSPDDIPDLIDMVGGAPLVIKLLEGTQGIGVVLAETRKAAESVIEAFMGLKANIMVQEYIKEAGGADIRCFVVGDRVVAAMKRQAAEGEFRSNLHRGGTASVIRITPDERATAVRAAKTMGLNVAGVDILRSKHGPLVMEVNSSPGLEGVESSTNIDVAGKIIEFIEKNGRVNHTRTRGKG